MNLNIAVKLQRIDIFLRTDTIIRYRLRTIDCKKTINRL